MSDVEGTCESGGKALLCCGGVGGASYRMRNELTDDTEHLFVEALVLPYVRYCMTVWGSCSVGPKKRVQKAINFGAGIVTGLNRREHITPALRKLGWGRIDDWLEKHDTLDRSIPGNRSDLHIDGAPSSNPD